MDKLKAALANCDEWARVKKQQGEATTHPKDGPTQELVTLDRLSPGAARLPLDALGRNLSKPFVFPGKPSNEQTSHRVVLKTIKKQS